MGMIMFILLGFSLLLLLISFFQKDPYKEIKEDIDQLTLQQVQEMYQIKKKLKVLEEELLIADQHFESAFPVNKSEREVHTIIKNQVWALAQQGKPMEQIAAQASLSQEDVYSILQEYADRGRKYE